jgi:ribose 5-phosphate isomerase RpiB
MRIAIAADGAGFEFKEAVKLLRQSTHDVLDLGTNGPEPVDYPDYAEAVGLAVCEGRVERAVLCGGSGAGAPVAAALMPGEDGLKC